MRELKNRYRHTGAGKGDLERQIGYLVRAVEDISSRLDEGSSAEKDNSDKFSDFKDKMIEETCSLKTQVSILATKIDGLEANLKKFIIITSSLVAGVATLVGSMDPSAVPSLFLSIKEIFI